MYLQTPDPSIRTPKIAFKTPKGPNRCCWALQYDTCRCYRRLDTSRMSEDAFKVYNIKSTRGVFSTKCFTYPRQQHLSLVIGVWSFGSLWQKLKEMKLFPFLMCASQISSHPNPFLPKSSLTTTNTFSFLSISIKHPSIFACHRPHANSELLEGYQLHGLELLPAPVVRCCKSLDQCLKPSQIIFWRILLYQTYGLSHSAHRLRWQYPHQAAKISTLPLLWGASTTLWITSTLTMMVFAPQIPWSINGS